MATIRAKVDGVLTDIEEVDLSAGVVISGIGESEEWDFTGTDDAPSTEVTPFIGGRPDDR